jgi:hypothetical protein
MSVEKTNTLLGIRYKCRHPRCYIDFGTLSHMESHFSDIHSDEKFTCDECGELFKRKMELSHHKVVNHIGYFTCPFRTCNEKRSCIQDLNLHMDTSFSNGGHGGNRHRRKPKWEEIK